VEDKHARYLVPVLGNQPGLYAAPGALDWENTPVAAATSQISRGRNETRTLRVLPAPAEPGFPGASQVKSARSAVPVFRPARFSGPFPAPGVPLSGHRALPESRPDAGDRPHQVAGQGDGMAAPR
jgi:hypothetical protein